MGNTLAKLVGNEGGIQERLPQSASLDRSISSAEKPFRFMGNALGKLLEQVFDNDDRLEVKGLVYLQKKNVFDLNEQVARLADDIWEHLGEKVEFQLVSVNNDPDTGVGKKSDKVNLEDWSTDHDSLTADGGKFYCVRFRLDKDFGMPGAILVDNHHPNWFYLDYILLELPDKSKIQFSCNSWIYNRNQYKDLPRIFFCNKAYLPTETPPGLLDLRYSELEQLRGDGTGERLRPDRIYDYEVYNDLGNPDKDLELDGRTTLGGSKEFPYPRRCRTGRARTESDPSCERPVLVPELIYVPRDERFGHIKKADFLGSSMKSFAHAIMPAVELLFQESPDFKGIEGIMDLYTKGVNLNPTISATETTDEMKKAEFKDPLEIIRELTGEDTGDSHIIKFPVPQSIQDNTTAWARDDEFAREMLAGLNPMIIERLTAFPPMSQLDPKVYGPKASSITSKHIEFGLEGLTVMEALHQNKLFILDYHDVYLPYIERINSLEGTKGYASRTILFLTKEGTLKVVAIELSLPPNVASGQKKINRVFVPPSNPKERNWIWQLAKTHVTINDIGYHQLISHWLQTHGSIEPFIIATHRQLSAMHPIHVLLLPHFTNTMNINAIARKILVNGYTGQFLIGGIIERCFLPGRYCMELSSIVYRSWHFNEQGLPADLIKRGMAIKDPTSKHGLKLMIKDYPFAVDGLEIWTSINEWVKEYVAIYYEDDASLENDWELQRWWKEVREVGHGDKVDDEGWVDLTTIGALEEVTTTLIWVASAHHAAVNFGQFSYGGFMPNKPTIGRKFIPNDDDEHSSDSHLFRSNPTAFFLQAVSTQSQAIIVMATLEILSTHSSDEEYLGTRNSPYWTCEQRVLQAFQRFSSRLAQIEVNITSRNADKNLKNRHGPINLPYTLLYRTSAEGLTGSGIPSSVSI